jgi:hypothetical protein
LNIHDFWDVSPHRRGGTSFRTHDRRAP